LQLHEGDRVAVMEFGRRSRVEEEFTANRERVIGELRNAVREEGLGSGTRTNAAIVSAAAYIEEEAARGKGAAGPAPGRRAVLVVTDNNSMDYQMPDERAISSLLAADTVLNAIVIGRVERLKPPKPGQYVNPDFSPSDVFHIAQETGGEAVKADRADVSFEEMIESIRIRYSIQYAAPESAAAGSFRRIRVDLTPEVRRRYPKAVVRARSGYLVKQ
jgi:VWFA-related protein